jgi:hypothetical protein
MYTDQIKVINISISLSLIVLGTFELLSFSYS